MLLTPKDEAEIDKIVAQTSRKYARKCWWAEEDELRQVAATAAAVARPHFNPEVGKVGPYFGRAIKRGVSNFLIRASCPASSSWHDRFKTIGIKRVGEEDPEAAKVLDGEDHGWADRILDDKRLRVRLLARLFEVVGADGRPGLEAMLSETKRGGRVAAPVQASIDLAVARIRADDECRMFWANRDLDPAQPEAEPDTLWQRAIRARGVTRASAAICRSTGSSTACIGSAPARATGWTSSRASCSAPTSTTRRSRLSRSR